MIQITKLGIMVSGAQENLSRLKTDFATKHYVHLPQLIEPGLLQLLSQRLNQAKFKRREHKGIGVELCLEDDRVEGLVAFLTNNSKLFEVVETVTGCAHIGCFNGRVYRIVENKGHYDSWHSDLIDDRLVAMSINLGQEPYAGGTLELRNHATKKILNRIENTGFGDGIIFRLSPNLQHRITEVKGNVPKTALAGWFCSKPDFFKQLNENPKPFNATNVSSSGSVFQEDALTKRP